jgi:hypothetical protein
MSLANIYLKKKNGNIEIKVLSIKCNYFLSRKFENFGNGKKCLQSLLKLLYFLQCQGCEVQPLKYNRKTFTNFFWPFEHHRLEARHHKMRVKASVHWRSFYAKT